MSVALTNVSIVIPVYNEAPALKACLEAIGRQTMKPLEVIVVDNGSDDQTAAIAASFDFVRVVHEPKRGIVFARNRGFDEARGDIIARIDADSILPEDWVGHITRFYDDPAHERLAFSGSAAFYNVRFRHAVAWLYNLLAFDFNHLLIGHPTLWGSNMALTRKQWRAVRTAVCRRTGIHEDLDLAIHLVQEGYGVHYDRHFRVGAHLRRVRSNRHELWEYLQWWPRTLKIHGKRTWWICWLFGCLMLYVITPLLTLAEYLARLAGRSPLKED